MAPQTIVFFGRSGSGKGTQAKLLIDFLADKSSDKKVLFIETGKLMRGFAENNDSLTGRTIKEILEKGGLLPEFVPVYLWGEYMAKNITGDEHIVCDGVSRRLAEAPVLDSAFRFYKREKPKIFLIDVSPQWATEKLLQRGRHDDNKAEIKRRMDWFEENTTPAIDYFKGNSFYDFHKINGEQPIDKVHADIMKTITI